MHEKTYAETGAVKPWMNSQGWLMESVTHNVLQTGVIPTLTWTGGLLGVRLRLEPKKGADIKAQFLAAREAVHHHAAMTDVFRSCTILNGTPMAASEGLEGRIFDTGFWAACTKQVVGQEMSPKPVSNRNAVLILKLIPGI